MNLTSSMVILSILISTLVCEARLLRVTPGFVQTKDTELVLNGSPFLFNGFNSYWMMNVAADPNQRYKVSNVFREASAIGLTVCRTWAFSDGGNQSLQISPGLYNEAMFQVQSMSTCIQLHQRLIYFHSFEFVVEYVITQFIWFRLEELIQVIHIYTCSL